MKAIKEKKDDWEPLMNGLPAVAAGLILCGSDGCRLAAFGRTTDTRLLNRPNDAAGGRCPHADATASR